MAGKRALERSKDTGDSNPGKKTKTEQPDASGEGIFEAARRRRLDRDAPPKDSSPAVSIEVWKKQWKELYPPEILHAVGAVRKQRNTSSTSSSPTVPPSVYVAINYVHGQYVDHALDILGAYATAASANDHAMAYFADEYPHLTGREPGDWKRSRCSSGDLLNTWDVDSEGCLSLIGEEEDSTSKVFVCKQAVKDNPPERKEPDLEPSYF